MSKIREVQLSIIQNDASEVGSHQRPRRQVDPRKPLTAQVNPGQLKRGRDLLHQGCPGFPFRGRGDQHCLDNNDRTADDPTADHCQPKLA